VDGQAVEEWWEAFRHACGIDADQHGTFAFGDSAGMVVDGRDRRVGPRMPPAGACEHLPRTTRRGCDAGEDGTDGDG
jgi:hypothetical protein